MEKNAKTKIFGILNLTPDSFSDGSDEILNLDNALAKAMSLYMHGADVLDIGAESTRPGASPVTEQEEIDRLVPFLLQFKKNIFWPVSIDTRKPKVAEAVLNYGVEYINDVTGLQHDPDMARVIAKNSDDCKIVVMHSKGGIPPVPSADVPDDFYGDDKGFLEHLIEFFSKSVEIAVASGIDKNRLVLDPGVGFGKSVDHNFKILRFLPQIKAKFELPVLVGSSRKSFLGSITAESNANRLEAGTAAFNSLAIQNGANKVRVHDVRFHRDVVRVSDAMNGIREKMHEIDWDRIKL